MRKAADIVVEVLLGLCACTVVLCYGLWLEATAPAPPGTGAGADFHSVVTDLGFSASHRNRIPIKHLEALSGRGAARLPLMGTISRRRIVEVAGEPVMLPFEYVFGPLLDELKVPIVGSYLSESATALPLSSNPVREAVISQRLAVQMFGTPEAAIGEVLRVASMQWMLTEGGDWEEFRITGVADPSFAGIDLESPAQFWVGINGWSNVLFPPQQVQVVREEFGASTLAVVTEQPGRVAEELEARLRRLGEAQPDIHLVPGAGYHPARRQRFAEIARAIVVGVCALLLVLAVCVMGFALLRAAHAMHSDRIRAMLGEPRRTWMRRSLAAGLRSVMVAAAAGFAWLGWLVFSGFHSLPVLLAGEKAVTDLIGFSLLLVLALLIVFLQPAISRLVLQRRIGLGVRTGSFFAMLFSLLIASVGISWFVGICSIQRLVALSEPKLPSQVSTTVTFPISNRDRHWMFDPRSTKGLELALEEMDVALASVGPVGPPIQVERGSITVGGEARSVLVPMNHVSRNYFRVLGVPTVRCGMGADDWPNGHVFVNREFLRREGLPADSPIAGIRLSDGQVLRVCGVVDDAHVVDARAGLAPMVYAPLNERRFLGAAVARGGAAPRQRAVMENALQAAFPDAVLGDAETTAEQVAAQLVEERKVIWLNATAMLAALLIGSATAVLLSGAAASMMLASLATRRALGAPVWRLVASTVAGPTRVPWTIAIAIFAAGIVAVLRLEPLASTTVLRSLAATGVGIAVVLVVIALRMRTAVNDRRLLDSLRSE